MAASSIVGSIAGGIASKALGGALGGNKAAKAQAGAAENAAAVQERIYQQQRADSEPYRAAGTAASNKLAYYMGLQPEGETALLASLPKEIQNAFKTRNPDAPMGSASIQDVIGKLSASKNDAEFRENAKKYGIYVGAYNNLDQRAWKDVQKAYQRGKLTPGTNGAQAGTNGEFGSLARKFSLDDYVADPGYQFRLDEGNKAIERAQARRGNFLSGAAIKEANKYNSGQASQEYGNAYNRFNQDQNTLYSRLSGLVNSGQGAANNSGAQNYANQMSNIYGQLGNVQGANALYQGNNFASGLFGGGGSSFGSIGAGLGSMMGGTGYGTGAAVYNSVNNPANSSIF
jgi:hypothetical protein